MATRFVTNLDLVQNQILNGRFEAVSNDPGTDNFDGRLIYNTTEGVIKVYDKDLNGLNSGGWRKILTVITSSTAALSVSETNGKISLSIADVVNGGNSGLMTGSDKTKLDNATATNTANTLAMRDADGRLKVSAPAHDLDAANKAYVDAARTGLDVKASVKVATTGPITLSTGLEAGDVIDGYTLAAGDRVLVKDQDTASENGIYVVAASGAPSRATDADSDPEVTPGLFTFVENGTLNADSGWVLVTDAPIQVGTTGLDFSLFSVAGNILAGEGLSKTGDVLNVNVDGTSIEINSDALRIAAGAAGDGLAWDAGVLDIVVSASGGLAILGDEVQIKLDPNVAGLTTTTAGLALKSDVAGDGLTFTAGVLSRNVIDLGQGSDDTTGTLPVDQGGTGATTEATARQNLALTTTGYTGSTPVLARISAQAIGNGIDTAYVLTHNFGTRNVVVQVFDSSTYDTVIADVERTSADTVTIRFSAAPATGAFTAVITG